MRFSVVFFRHFHSRQVDASYRPIPNIRHCPGVVSAARTMGQNCSAGRPAGTAGLAVRVRRRRNRKGLYRQLACLAHHIFGHLQSSVRTTPSIHSTEKVTMECIKSVRRPGLNRLARLNLSTNTPLTMKRIAASARETHDRCLFIATYLPVTTRWMCWFICIHNVNLKLSRVEQTTKKKPQIEMNMYAIVNIDALRRSCLPKK